MKTFHLFAAAVLVISGATAHADPFVGASAAQPDSAPTTGYMVPVGASAYQDYPPYPPGFSSYRGLGFMGFCCEPISPCVASAWDGYCDEKACGDSAYHPTLSEKIHAWLCRPAPTCCPPSCDPCVKDPSASDWPVRPSCCFGRRLWLRGSSTGIPSECQAGCESCGKDSEPAAPEKSEAIETLPQPPAPGPATPEATSGVIPNLPSPPAPERSASRADLRRLPSVEVSY
jgi:hypothetical protein